MNTHTHTNPTFVPGLGREWLTPYYDAALASIFQEWRFRRPLVEAVRAQIDADPDAVVLEVGCGTATVSLLIQAVAPQATVVATDIDGVMLGRAQRKTETAASPLALCAASADLLPARTGSVDTVVSSLMFHHLPMSVKQAMLAEIMRVLRPGGVFFLLDFGPPRSPALAHIVRSLLGSFEHADVNLAGEIPSLLEAAGFAGVIVDDVAFGGLIKLLSAHRDAE